MTSFSGDEALLYMKVGTHAQEDLADIIARKSREIEQAGLSMWGYGGNTCHPTTMVQPFARRARGASRPIILCMQPMDSRHSAEPIRAEEYSVDGVGWQPVPEAINVLGSRYALCINSLEEVDEELDLEATRVALGNSMGKRGDKYVRGRVDKACLEIADPSEGSGDNIVPIRLVAEIVEPYAVFLRN